MGFLSTLSTVLGVVSGGAGLLGAVTDDSDEISEENRAQRERDRIRSETDAKTRIDQDSALIDLGVRTTEQDTASKGRDLFLDRDAIGVQERTLKAQSEGRDDALAVERGGLLADRRIIHRKRNVAGIDANAKLALEKSHAQRTFNVERGIVQSEFSIASRDARRESATAIERTNREALIARGRAEVAGAESGGGGRTTTRLERDVQFVAGHEKARTRRDLVMDLRALRSRKSSALSRLNLTRNKSIESAKFARNASIRAANISRDAALVRVTQGLKDNTISKRVNKQVTQLKRTGLFIQRKRIGNERKDLGLALSATKKTAEINHEANRKKLQALLDSKTNSSATAGAPPNTATSVATDDETSEREQNQIDNSQ